MIPEVTRQAEKIKDLQVAVEALRIAAERSAKVQRIQSAELEHVKSALMQTQHKVKGLKIARGQYKSKAQKLLEQVEQHLN